MSDTGSKDNLGKNETKAILSVFIHVNQKGRELKKSKKQKKTDMANV